MRVPEVWHEPRNFSGAVRENTMNPSNADHSGRIVVGVDGSAGSKTALKWAMNQARLTNATVEAVTTWQERGHVRNDIRMGADATGG